MGNSDSVNRVVGSEKGNSRRKYVKKMQQIIMRLPITTIFFLHHHLEKKVIRYGCARSEF